MKKILLFVIVTVIVTFYSCTNDTNNLVGYPYQQVTIYQSRLFDTLTIYTSVNDSLFLGNFDFKGYDSISVKMSFEMSTNGAASPFVDYRLVNISNGGEIDLIRQNLPGSGGTFILDAKFNAPQSGDLYFRDRSANLGTGFFKIVINSFRMLKH